MKVNEKKNRTKAQLNFESSQLDIRLNKNKATGYCYFLRPPAQILYMFKNWLSKFIIISIIFKPLENIVNNYPDWRRCRLFYVKEQIPYKL